jgi:hypothetical protein
MQPHLGYNTFGWAHLRNSVSGVELLGSSVSYDYPGIIVGTDQVPNPKSLAIELERNPQPSKRNSLLTRPLALFCSDHLQKKRILQPG